MNARDAIVKALTPGDMFNQKGHVWRSVSTLTQFASCGMAEILDILDEHFQGLVTVKPNTSHPERGPLVALNQHVPVEGAPQVQILGGNAVQAAIEGVDAAPEQPVDPAEVDDLAEAPEPEAEQPVAAVVLDPMAPVEVEVHPPEAEDL